ncbi:MAG: alpha/beta hydrolase [Weeksellaceae bacterium]|nr:alpha/beta hydrolase [Weeksellaceae bacterium]
MKKSALQYRFLTAGLLGMFLISCNTKHRIWVGEKGDQKIFNLKYGDHKKQVMDIFLPATYTPDTPVTMIVHGGAWKYGRKQHMIMIQKFLHQNNIPTVNIDYRHASKRKKITYKEQLQDIALAGEKFNSLASKAKLLPNNFVLLGESAGAHLALLYGYSNPDHIKKIISMSGPTDFYSKAYLQSAHSWYSKPTIQTMVGEKYERTAVSEKFKEASPINRVSSVPTLLFQGDSDYLVNSKQALSLDSVLTEKQIPHRLIFMKDTGHTPRFFNKYKRDSIILPAILDWIKK